MYLECPLAALTSLELLSLLDNPVLDLSPLVTNAMSVLHEWQVALNADVAELNASNVELLETYGVTILGADDSTTD